MTKYQALHSHDIQLCIHVCHKQTDIYIFHQANSVQTNRASCVFVRQKVFCQTKTNLPSLTVGGFSSEVGNL